VTIAYDRLRVKSSHALVSERDHALAATWPSGGQSQLAHGLLFESIRREAILCFLICLQRDPEWLTKLQTLSDARRAEAIAEIAQKVEASIKTSLSRLSLRAVEETYASMVKPLGGSGDA